MPENRTVTIRTLSGGPDASPMAKLNHYIQCPEKYLIELVDSG